MVKSRSAWSNIITRIRIPGDPRPPVSTTFQYKGRTVEITDDPSNKYDLPVKITIDGQDRTGVWFLCGDDHEIGPEGFAIRLIDMESSIKHGQAAIEAKQAKMNTADAACASYVANAAKDDEACKEYVKSKKAEIRTVLDEFNRLPSPLSEGVDKLITEKLEAAYAAKKVQKVEETRAAEEATQGESDLASIFTMDSRKQAAMLKAWKRRNRISKAVRIVIANIVAAPVYALFDKIGLGWASWLVAIVVMVYSMMILVSPETSASWRAHLEKWK
jgi:hypothetical protein